MYQDNSMVTGANEARFRLPAPLTPLVFLLMFAVSQFAAVPLSILWDHATAQWQGFEALTLKYTISNLILPFGLSIAMIFLWVKFVERRPIRTLGFPKPARLKTYLQGFGFGILLMSLYVLLATLFGVYALDNMQFKGFSISVWLPVFLTLPGWIIQGASEEIMTRGWLFQAASKKHVLTGIVLSSMIFAMLHLANNGITVLSFINLVL